ncbi:MAG: FkbM family methyltransferase [Planctomycetota bacterium]|nr:FkbM family methyltransferase [Planctomycetota bacterium]
MGNLIRGEATDRMKDACTTSDPLFQLLQPERRTAVVDVGANPIDGVPPYKPMLERKLCTVVGFDPQESAHDSLQEGRGPLETYLPYAIGDGSEQTLHVCSAPGMTSFLTPDVRSLSLFPLFPEFGRVVAAKQVQTRPLDAIEEIEDLDFLKIDVQGSELAVFRSGREKLSAAVAIQTEASFLPLYENQPPIGLLDTELRSQGFIPHALVELKRWVISPLLVNNNPRIPLNQLLEADLVYVRDFRNPQELTEEQLKHLALIAHHCYRSFDLALFCLAALEGRGSLATGARDVYLNMLPASPA